MKTKIIGAGLAGLLAASHFHDPKIYERNTIDKINRHKALLRFRKPDIGEHLGIPFKQVAVHKGIWSNGGFVQPNVRDCNSYSLKVSGMLTNRSIWNIENSTRWIAPVNLHEILLDRYADRIVGGIDFDFKSRSDSIAEGSIKSEPIISTIPMPSLLKKLNNEAVQDMQIDSKGIYVERFEVDNCDVYQTIYYPDPDIPLYRASLTGNMLIVEYIDYEFVEHCKLPTIALDSVAITKNIVLPSFGIDKEMISVLDCSHKSDGKIRPIDDVKRKRIIHELTINENIFSLGRLAIWKGVLLDDVFHDIQVIKKLMNAEKYEIVKKGFVF